MRRRSLLTGALSLAAISRIDGARALTGSKRFLFLGGHGAKVNFVAEGDSITYGQGGQPSWPFVAQSLMPGAVGAVGVPTAGSTSFASPVIGIGNLNVFNIASSGISTVTVDGLYSTRAGAAYNASADLNILSVMLGTNTSGANDDSADEKYWFIRNTLRKAEAQGYKRRIICAMIPRNDDGGTTWTTLLVPLNARFLSLWNSDLRCDAYIDWTQNVNFSTNTSAESTTYYDAPIDKVHPSIVGEALMGSIAQPMMLAAMQGPGARTQVLSWSTISGDQAPTAALSNGNRTQLGSGNIIAFPATNTGDIYFEINVDVVGSFCAIGLVNEAWLPNGTNIYGSTNAVAWLADGRFFINGAQVATGTVYTTGDRLQFVHKRSIGKGWMRPIRAGTPLNWNGSASANPDTNSGGFDVSTLGAGNYVHPAANPGGATTQLTTCFASSQQIGPLPSGCSTYG